MVRGKQDLHETGTGIRAGEDRGALGCWRRQPVPLAQDMQPRFYCHLQVMFFQTQEYTQGNKAPMLLFLLHVLPAPVPTHHCHSPVTPVSWDFPVPAKGEAVTLHTGISVILSAGDNKKEAPVAGVAVPDTGLGAQSLLMTQCRGLYFSQELTKRLRTSSFPSQMCAI